MGYNYLSIMQQTGLARVAVFAKQAIPDLFTKHRAAHGAVTYTPAAMYWIMLLWKRLMGTSVHNVTISNGAGKGLVAAARSARAAGGVVVAVANVLDTAQTISLSGNGFGGGGGGGGGGAEGASKHT